MRAVTPVDRRSDGRPAGETATGLPLLTAKMRPPDPGEAVPRTRLFSRLDEAAGRPVTLLAAPAGWGKTVLLASWVRGRHSPGDLAWLTVEPGDTGPLLWSYLADSLTADDRGMTGAIPPAGTGSLVHLAAALAHRLSPVTLVVDGADHSADPDFGADLDYLVSHADGRLRLILTARTVRALPVHRWRLGGVVTELGAEDLAFTTAEVIELLASRRLSLPGAQAEQLRDRAEGWPAGLCLAAISLAGHPEPARFVAEFAGDLPMVADYLAEEVAAALSPEAVEAFTRCAIEEQLSGGLVDALTGGTGGAGLLAEAAGRTGFTIQVGVRPDTYRHHRMLDDLFRSRLRSRPESAVRELHRGAARWFADHDHPARALRHALAGHDWDVAERLLAERWRDLLPPTGATGPAPPVPPAEKTRERPALALAYAADRLAAHDLPAADAHLRLAGADEHRLSGQRNSGTALVATALRLGRAQLDGNSTRILAAANRLLALAQPDPSAEPVDVGARAIARVAAGSGLLSEGRLAAAENQLTAGVADADRAGLPRTAVAGSTRLAVVQALRGRLRAADRSAHLALGRLGAEQPADRAAAYLSLALVAADRDRPDEAAAHLMPVAPAADPVISALADLAAARLHRDRGDLPGSYQLLQAGRQRASGVGESSYLASCFAAAEADLQIARGDLDSARARLSPLVGGQAEPAGLLAVALSRVHLRAGDPHAAACLLDGWTDREDDSWPLAARLEAGVLAAEAARRVGDGRRSARLLELVLALAEPERHRRVFIRADPSARDLLAAHLDTGTAHWALVSELLANGSAIPRLPAGPDHHRLDEPLTERELTVLRYLQSILSNVEIANELSVSVNTVKTHVRSIYRKLDATRRRDAVRRAREIHLL